MSSIASRIVAVLRARLEAITVADGYSCDAGYNVTVGRMARESADDIAARGAGALLYPPEGSPTLLVLDESFDGAVRRELTMTAELSILPTSIDAALDEGFALAADLQRALLAPAYGPLSDAGGALAEEVTPGPITLDLPAAGEAMVRVAMDIAVRYFERRGDAATL